LVELDVKETVDSVFLCNFWGMKMKKYKPHEVKYSDMVLNAINEFKELMKTMTLKTKKTE
jgi:hypothetical protein